MMRKLWNFGQIYEFEEYGSKMYAHHGDEVVHGVEGCKIYDNSSSPPPPYSEEDLLNFPSPVIMRDTNTPPCKERNGNPYIDKDDEEENNDDEWIIRQAAAEKSRKQSYSDVGEEIIVTVGITHSEEIGLILLNGESFSPSWPTILDIKEGSPAHHAIPRLQIGDQIKELDDIPTESLTHAQVIALFSKATDSVTMTLRRGVEPTKRQFQWFRFPFLSVNKCTEQLLIKNYDPSSRSQRDPRSPANDSNECENYKENRRILNKFSTFREEKKIHETRRFNDMHIDDVSRVKISRSSSASAATRSAYLQDGSRQRRNTMDEVYNNRHNMLLGGYFRRYDLALRRKELRSPTCDSYRENDGVTGGKYIADEIEKLSLSSSRQSMSSAASSSTLHMSKSSLSSDLSSSTISSLSSTSTNEQIINRMNGIFIDTSNNDYADMFEEALDHHEVLDLVSKIHTTGPDLTLKKTPVNKLRDSFRRKKNKTTNTVFSSKTADYVYCNGNGNEKAGNGATNNMSTSILGENNTITVAVWVPDRRKLGLKLGGGSVSLYGDSNISVVDIKKSGSAAKHFKIGDEILEVDGSSTHNMDVFQVNRLISKLEGNFVEFKVFRPNTKI